LHTSLVTEKIKPTWNTGRKSQNISTWKDPSLWQLQQWLGPVADEETAKN